MLALHQVHVRFGAQLSVLGLRPAELVLRGVDLHLARGRTLALVGPSGCGKTTALRVVAGLVRPSEGRVEIAGEDLARADLQRVRHQLGYVVQDGGLFPHLSARDNVTLVARHLGWEARRIDARVEELCALARLATAALDRRPAELSGGQRQRVGLMRALMLEPKLLLLDEPLGALDPLVRAALQDDLRAIFRAVGATVVLVTHDLAEAAWFGDELAVLHEGRVVAHGPPAEVLGAPVDPFVRAFVAAHRGLHLEAFGGAAGATTQPSGAGLSFGVETAEPGPSSREAR
ncbi:MAG: ATP-binding cassette domain-containing protein [Myxococcota bacterium]